MQRLQHLQSPVTGPFEALAGVQLLHQGLLQKLCQLHY
jgi:hypothetical protein